MSLSDTPRSSNPSADATPVPDTFEVIDERVTPFAIVPSYVLDDYGPQIGPVGIAVYVALAMHVHHVRGDCWPSYATLASKLGIHRGTVCRTIQLLARVGLVRVEARHGEGRRRRSNRYFLVNPPGAAGEAARPAAAASRCTAAPYVAPAQRGVAPAQQGVAPRGQELDPLNQIQGRGGEAPPPPPAPSPSPHAEAVATLLALWMRCLRDRGQQRRKEDAAEFPADAANLLRHGWTEAALAATISDPERDQRERPRVWHARLLEQAAVRAARDQAARDQAAREQRRREDAEHLERVVAGRPQVLAMLRERVRHRNGQP